MAAKISLAIGLRTLFTVLGLLMLAVFLYTAFTDGLGVRFLKELVRPWMVATLVCFYINIVAFAVWIAYKESNLISSILWIVLIALLGRNGTAPQRQRSSVVTLRIIFSILGVVMLGTLVYTLVTNGSPFRKGVLTPWLATTLVDIYFHIVIYAVWVAYKESSWISAVFWIILLICFSSMATCLYITWQLFQISCQDPAYLVLVHHGDRAENEYTGISGEAT
ncbi:uncharacterized protein LOC114402778 isoform X2 [Glycine soja]|uniref:Uncharacterized protein n=1 Tax=Glycine soja TaxID=3848 RepID=A0A445F696_GLYSO|nr:uncharacterized protein LOC114402778 isoform X2 [Glycine soja]RZB44361.1 hypothetical protein D0Y65_054382 [Glycine soja]|eukprot:XP_006606189.1 uncharacterized protein LOC100784580 isoform X2 [Glycine max]